ncbi:unnamed protein product [Nippostrongylus brasiliensis]|uniref:TMV resistance protein N-like n=1 Tax=Nippostrongylus brasiliensis TaxID=27835 RepID=A0A158R2W5_NIPBR|nr:unnamed protein product [Nippostrongylus brasiliensis]
MAVLTYGLIKPDQPIGKITNLHEEDDDLSLVSPTDTEAGSVSDRFIPHEPECQSADQPLVLVDQQFVEVELQPRAEQPSEEFRVNFDKTVQQLATTALSRTDVGEKVDERGDFLEERRRLLINQPRSITTTDKRPSNVGNERSIPSKVVAADMSHSTGALVMDEQVDTDRDQEEEIVYSEEQVKHLTM